MIWKLWPRNGWEFETHLESQRCVEPGEFNVLEKLSKTRRYRKQGELLVCSRRILGNTQACNVRKQAVRARVVRAVRKYFFQFWEFGAKNVFKTWCCFSFWKVLRRKKCTYFPNQRTSRDEGQNAWKIFRGSGIQGQKVTLNSEQLLSLLRRLSTLLHNSSKNLKHHLMHAHSMLLGSIVQSAVVKSYAKFVVS